jgi:hypothetical protein
MEDFQQKTPISRRETNRPSYMAASEDSSQSATSIPFHLKQGFI